MTLIIMKFLYMNLCTMALSTANSVNLHLAECNSYDTFCKTTLSRMANSEKTFKGMTVNPK